MKKLFLIPLAYLLIGGCSTTTDITGNINKAEPYIRPASALACSGVLLLATNGQDRIDIAADIYTVSTVIYSLSGGQVPTPEQLQNAISVATPKSSEWATLATTLSGIYAGVFPEIKGDPKLALKILSDIAGGAQDSASAYYHPSPTP